MKPFCESSPVFVSQLVAHWCLSPTASPTLSLSLSLCLSLCFKPSSPLCLPFCLSFCLPGASQLWPKHGRYSKIVSPRIWTPRWCWVAKLGELVVSSDELSYVSKCNSRTGATNKFVTNFDAFQPLCLCVCVGFVCLNTCVLVLPFGAGRPLIFGGVWPPRSIAASSQLFMQTWSGTLAAKYLLETHRRVLKDIMDR